jgi:hypothetical protein
MPAAGFSTFLRHLLCNSIMSTFSSKLKPIRATFFCAGKQAVWNGEMSRNSFKHDPTLNIKAKLFEMTTPRLKNFQLKTF